MDRHLGTFQQLVLLLVELDEWARDACYYATSDDTSCLTSDAMSDYAFPATRMIDTGDGHPGHLLLVHLK